MKKILYFTTVLAGLLLVACSSDDTLEQNRVAPVKTYYMSIDATKASNDDATHTNRALSLTSHTLTPSWAVGEKVYVYAPAGIPDPFWFNGYLEAKSAGTTTQLNGALSLPWAGEISTYVPEPYMLTLQFPRSGDLDYTGQVGTLADVAAKYDYAVAENVQLDIEGDHIRAVSEDGVKFHSQQAIVKFTLKDKADEGATLLNATSLIVEYNSESIVLTGIPAETTYTTNGNGVLFVALPALTKAEADATAPEDAPSVALTAVVGGKTYSFSKEHFTFQNGKYYEIGVKMAEAYRMAANATTEDKGKLICTDGHIHAYNADAACTKDRVAKIIYVGTTGHATYTHGLALALADEGQMDWSAACTACNTTKNTSTPVTDATWLLANMDQWNYMLGTSGAGSYTALRNGFTSVGGTNMADNLYWSSTEGYSDRAWGYYFHIGEWLCEPKTSKYYYVRSALAF